MVVGEQNVNVLQSHNKHHRKWEKKYACPYCEKLFPKLPRHLAQMHKEKVDVATALAYPEKLKERRSHLDALSNKGNYPHNVEVLKQGKGNIIPYRRPNHVDDAADYIPCSKTTDSTDIRPTVRTRDSID